MADKRIAVYSGTKNIYPIMITSAKSLVANSAVDKVVFLAEDEWIEGLPESDIFEVRDVSGQEYFKPDGPNIRSQFSYMALMRACLWDLFRMEHRVLSLDHDVIVCKDCTDIWDIDLTGCYFAASLEPHRSNNGLVYTNTGVCLHNIDLEIQNDFGREVVRTLNQGRYEWVEQDVYNYMGQGRIAIMPSVYNANDWTLPHPPHKTIIKHYAGIPSKVFITQPLHRSWADTSWDSVLRVHEERKRIWEER